MYRYRCKGDSITHTQLDSHKVRRYYLSDKEANSRVIVSIHLKRNDVKLTLIIVNLYNLCALYCFMFYVMLKFCILYQTDDDQKRNSVLSIFEQFRQCININYYMIDQKD